MENKYASRWRTLGHLLSGPVGVAVGSSITLLSAMTGVVIELYYIQGAADGKTKDDKLKESFEKAFAVSAITAITTLGVKLTGAIISNKADNSEKLQNIQKELKQIERFFNAETDQWLDTVFGTDPSEKKALDKAIAFIEKYHNDLMKVDTNFKQSVCPQLSKFKRFHGVEYVGNTLYAQNEKTEAMLNHLILEMSTMKKQMNAMKEQNDNMLELLGGGNTHSEPKQEPVEESKDNLGDGVEDDNLFKEKGQKNE